MSRNSYFVSQEEIDANRKSSLASAWLAIFLGWLGVHRFYLKRYKSGVLIIIVNSLSLGLALAVTLPLVFIEGIYYAYLGNKRRRLNRVMKPQPSLKGQLREVNEKFKEDMRANNAEFKKNIDDIFTQQRVSEKPEPIDLNIVEVSKVHPASIPSPATHAIDTDWLELLEIPYERETMQVRQVKHETLKLYKAICGVVDKELQDSGNSLMKLKRRLDKQGGYYSNVLYTLYCIAEGEIVRHYDASQYDNSYSYDLLRDHTGSRCVKAVRNYCRSYAREHVTPPDENTRIALHLTPNGLARVWWDEDGSIRGRQILTPAQIKLLDRTPYRSTVILEIPEVRLLVIAQYLTTMSTVRQLFQNTRGWPTKTAEYLNYLFGKRSNYDSYDYATAWFAQYVLKLCEQTIRQNVPYSRLLKAEMEIAYIKEIAPAKASLEILERAAQPIAPLRLSKKAIEALRKQNPKAWKRDVLSLQESSSGECARILQLYRDDPDFATIAKQAIKYAVSSQDNHLLACYAYCATTEEAVEKPIQRVINGLITHPAQQQAFMKLASQKLPFNMELIEVLKILTKPPVRSVKLDTQKVEAANAAHEEAVKRVTTYLGTDETSEKNTIVSTVQPKDNISIDDLFGGNENINQSDNPILTIDQIEFLRMVAEADYKLEVAQAESFAKSKHKLLGGLLQGINQAYYETLEDQILCTVDDKITIEEMYHEKVKEIMK